MSGSIDYVVDLAIAASCRAGSPSVWLLPLTPAYVSDSIAHAYLSHAIEDCANRTFTL